MSRYEELARVATERAKTINDQGNACQKFAHRVIQGFKQYLGCPPGMVLYYPVDPRLRTTGEGVDVDNQLPSMRTYRDKFWYFVCEITFLHQVSRRYVACRSLIGVKQTANTFIVRSEKDLPVDPAKPSDLEAVYQQLYEEFKVFCEHPYEESDKRIGFRPPDAE
jgi:hypothetical protein